MRKIRMYEGFFDFFNRDKKMLEFLKSIKNGDYTVNWAMCDKSDFAPINCYSLNIGDNNLRIAFVSDDIIVYLNDGEEKLEVDKVIVRSMQDEILKKYPLYKRLYKDLKTLYDNDFPTHILNDFSEIYKGGNDTHQYILDLEWVTKFTYEEIKSKLKI